MIYRHFLLLTVTGMVSGLPVAAENFLIGVGTDISRGSYGQTTETEVRVDYLQFRYEIDDLLFRFDLPYLHIRGPANTISTSRGELLLGNVGTARQSTEGWGDLTLGLSRSVLRGDGGRWALDMGARIKLPTAKAEQGLGTGKTDYLLQADFYYSERRWTYFASLGYKWMGSPEGVTYRNSGIASLGTTYRVSGDWLLGAVMDYRRAVISDQPDPCELMLFATHELGSGWRSQTYLYGGTNTASPELGGGVSLGRRF